MSTRARGTDGSLLASLPWTIGALAVSIAPHLPYLPIWIIAAFLACALWRYLIEKRRRSLPSVWFRAGLALACFLGVLCDLLNDQRRRSRARHCWPLWLP